MAATVEQIVEDALALPDESRLVLAERLVQSVHAHADPELEAMQSAEMRRRIEEVRSGRVSLVPGEAVLLEVREAIRHTGSTACLKE